MDSCDLLVTCIVVLCLSNRNYLHGATQPEDAVVGLLWLEALECGLDNVVLFGEQVVGPVRQSALAHAPVFPYIPHRLSILHLSCRLRGCVPQSELPVSGGVAVPVCERLHPALQPRALVDEGCERRRRHVFGGSTGCAVSEVWEPSMAGCVSGGGEAVRVSLSVRRKV
jgi:hypothetical protein